MKVIFAFLSLALSIAAAASQPQPKLLERDGLGHLRSFLKNSLYSDFKKTIVQEYSKFIGETRARALPELLKKAVEGASDAACGKDGFELAERSSGTPQMVVFIDKKDGVQANFMGNEQGASVYLDLNGGKIAPVIQADTRLHKIIITKAVIKGSDS